MKLLKDDVLTIMEEASKQEVEGLKRHVEVHTINVNNASVDEIFLCVQSASIFKSRDRKITHQDTRNMLNARVTQKEILEE